MGIDRYPSLQAKGFDLLNVTMQMHTGLDVYSQNIGTCISKRSKVTARILNHQMYIKR